MIKPYLRYPEYIACREEIRSRDTGSLKLSGKLLELEDRKAGWVELQPGQSGPLIYFKGRVMVEYLMDIRGMSYDEILSEEIKGGVVHGELVRWHAARAR